MVTMLPWALWEALTNRLAGSGIPDLQGWRISMTQTLRWGRGPAAGGPVLDSDSGPCLPSGVRAANIHPGAPAGTRAHPRLAASPPAPGVITSTFQASAQQLREGTAAGRACAPGRAGDGL